MGGSGTIIVPSFLLVVEIGLALSVPYLPFSALRTAPSILDPD